MASQTRIEEHKRRREGGECVLCTEPIEPGQRYRSLTNMDAKMEVHNAHVSCVKHDPAWEVFELTPQDAGLKPVRLVHGVRYRCGVTVLHAGLPGRITGGANGFVNVELNGVTKTVVPTALVFG